MGRWGRRIVEYHAIEQAVEDVSCCSCRNKCQADKVSPTDAALNAFANIPNKRSNSNDTERGEKPLVEDFHAECHAVILGKENVKPIRDTYALIHIHTRLDGYLYGLVNSNDANRKADSSKCLDLFASH